MLEILNSGLFSSFQDIGRFGLKQYGVSNSGCQDLYSFTFANLLLKNDINEACIEIVGGNFKCKFFEKISISVTGPPEQCLINNENRFETYSSVNVEVGDVLEIKPSKMGRIHYLSVSGGFDLNKILGSYSYHSPSTITDEYKLNNNQKIRFKRPKITTPMIIDQAFYKKYIESKGIIKIIYNQDINKQFMNQIESREYIVNINSNRQAIKLESDPIKEFLIQNEISNGVTLGTVQIPPDGLPIILMQDSQTVGGYKTIGVVPKYQIPSIAQMQPNIPIKFQGVTLSEATRINRTINDEINRSNFLEYQFTELYVNNKKISVKITENDSIIAIADDDIFEVYKEIN